MHDITIVQNRWRMRWVPLLPLFSSCPLRAATPPCGIPAFLPVCSQDADRSPIASPCRMAKRELRRLRQEARESTKLLKDKRALEIRCQVLDSL